MSQDKNSLPVNRFATRLSTRLVFFVAGFVMGCWSPLIPFVKERLALDDAGLGLLLLCFGIGSVFTMPIAGLACSRFGNRNVIVAGGAGLALAFPAVALLGNIWSMAGLLLWLGAFLGALEVGMNSHAVDVETGSTRPLMSGFHAMFSIGGFSGAGGLSLLLSFGLTPLAAAALSASLVLSAIVAVTPWLLGTKGGEESAPFVTPKGVVLVIAGLTALTFLMEGALLDWGALLLTSQGLVEVSMGGFGYMVFSLAMTAGRLFGDRYVAAVGGKNALLWGGATAILGVLLIAGAPSLAVSGAGFLLVGLGASNIVPVLFSLAGRQAVMPAGQAVAAIATAGYGGILLGPAAIGFIAEYSGLEAAFVMLAFAMSIIPLCAALVTSQASTAR